MDPMSRSPAAADRRAPVRPRPQQTILPATAGMGCRR
jgi:hypothetical protein